MVKQICVAMVAFTLLLALRISAFAKKLIWDPDAKRRIIASQTLASMMVIVIRLNKNLSSDVNAEEDFLVNHVTNWIHVSQIHAEITGAVLTILKMPPVSATASSEDPDAIC